MKNRGLKKLVSIFISAALIIANFVGIGTSKVVMAAGSGTEDSPYSISEAIQYVKTTFASTNASGTVCVKGYIVGVYTKSTPKGIILADSSDESTSSLDNNKLLYVIAHANTPQNVEMINQWNTEANIGKMVKVSGTWRKNKVAAYGTEKVATIGTVSGNDLIIEEISEDNPNIEKTAGVTASPKPGAVVLGTVVSLSCVTTGATIYFTGDNSEPSTSSAIYSEPIVIDSATTIKAMAQKSGMESSDISTFTYTIDEPQSVIKISDARQKAKGTKVTISGIVTFVDEGSATAPYNVYIQDETAAIDLCYYKNFNITLNQGDKVQVTGNIDIFNGLLEVKPKAAQDIKVLSSNNPMPEPKVITIADAKSDTYESQLVKINNVTIGEINTNGDTIITDANGDSTKIYKIPALEGIKANDKVDIVAIVSEYSTSTSSINYQLRCRSAADIKKADVGLDDELPIISDNKTSIGNTALDLTIYADVTDNREVREVKLYYKLKGAAEYTEIPMVKDSSNKDNPNMYTAVISKEKLSTSGLLYYIEAIDGANNKATLPQDISKPFEVAISDKDVIKPVISDIKPRDGECTGKEYRPEIKASYTDNSGINTSSVKLYVDDINVTTGAAITEKNITYKPESDLKAGKHTVRLNVSDNAPVPNSAEKQWSFTVGEGNYNYYFGQLHSHTNISDGQGTLEEAYTWARDKGHADYFAVTDHSNSLDNDKDCSITDGSKSPEWVKAHETADKYNENNKFVAIYGYEMTWSGSTGGYGHMNTFNTPGFETRNNSKMNLENYYKTIASQPQSLSQLNHPGKTFGDFEDFGYYSKAADDVINLVEVGNGEGTVRGSGYFPSYEYYTRALDKGWHVAPSNNQDNHKGGWITANTARTVILAPELTRDSVYDAMRAMRVYATEDNNLKIDYKVNGKVMGSFLGNTDKLSFDINITDPDNNDNIGKVSIISNGGTVVEEKNFDSNAAEWKFELPSQYSYYYVRVDEKDKDIAVTAPVWVGEMVSAGISKVETSESVSAVNTPVDINAQLYNNGKDAINNVKVEFFKNEIKDENKIGEANINTIESCKTSSAAITWTPDRIGEYTIYARTMLTIEGVSRVFTESTKISIRNVEDILKVVIDAGHQNQYVSGDYKGKITQFKKMLEEKGCMVVENKDTIISSDLDGARLLVLTDPQSTDNSEYRLKKSYYTDEEVAVIKAFVEKCGSLILTSRADYKDAKDIIYSNGAQGNKVLEAVGTNLRINDDEVIDNKSNGGQNFRLSLDDYNSVKYNLTEGVPEGQTYSFYSGCSVLLKPHGNDSSVDYVVMGHDTTETIDSDKHGDNTPVEKGKVCVLAVEELSNKSKIVVAGSTFFSDFETIGDNPISNSQITKNILDWILSPKAELKKISEVRVDANKDGIPDYLGKKFAVEGRVTAESMACGNKHSFFDCIYVQDETGGITVFGVSTRKFALGQKVKVTGMVDQYLGDEEIQISNENTDIKIIGDDIQEVQPGFMYTADSMKEEKEGWLVKVQGKVTKTDGQNLYIDDGSGSTRVFLEGYVAGSDSKVSGKWDENIKIGDKVSAIGLASEDPEGHRMRVRNAAEILLKEPKVQVTKLSEETEFKPGSDAKVILRCKNITSTNQNVSLITAVFDSITGRLLNYSLNAQSINKGQQTDITGTIKLPAGNNMVVRCFVWDNVDMNSMNPLSDVIEIPVR